MQLIDQETRPVIYRDLQRAYPTLVRGEGIYLWVSAGKRYIDGAAGSSSVANMGRVVPGERIMLPLATDGRSCDGVLGASHYQRPAFFGEGAPIQVISDNEVWTALN